MVAVIPQPFEDWKLPARYEKRQAIGTGSYGTVAEAYDTATKKIVAIKKIPRVFEDLVDCKRVLREVAILNRLKHENVVKVVDVIIPNDLNKFDEIYIVLEIADSDLKKLVRTPVYLSELHVRTLLYNLLVGLKFTHSAGIYHRDLKPANCLVNQDCSVKICDFGLARTVDTPLSYDRGGKRPAANLKEQLTMHVVTRWYRAPELILLQEHYTEAIDIWSVGCIFAELLTMVKETCLKPNERLPLFPGTSCFPLSPDEKHGYNHQFHTRGNKDQLDMIFNVLGTPSNDDVEALVKEDARRYVRIFPHKDPIDLNTKFPGASTKAIDLLKKMLQFNPDKRINVDEALNHPLFRDIRNNELETTADKKVRLPFNDWMPLTADQLRYAFLKEAQVFHPDLKIPDHLAKTGYGNAANNTIE
ncbi:mitogen-activated protein kinase [Gregarina niphandrodes]|uniref:Mitogen-activated protein kinase n=1 Tax=Gregarina niphandrodes TaxID=110365 RepID=A0A023B5Y6_GRENI|nr:mitogen-activated protein kinase [Gregarina niphandrodes]EZG64224.1 mitogen-activated protein kinase [Gregarina niphandrodes]|eukprot:XP_011130649.1 mitogen-activated protein kinase [Gregarina niphandrodes]